MIDGKKELKSGSGIANQKLETEVDISSLPDGENYRLQIDAVVTDTDETELTTSAVTGEGFSVKDIQKQVTGKTSHRTGLYRQCTGDRLEQCRGIL